MGQGFLAKTNRIWEQKNRTILYIVFIIAALIQGIAYSFLLPFGQVPDEPAHYDLIEKEFGTEGYAGELINGVWHPGGYSNLPRNSTAKVNPEEVASVSSSHFSKPLSLTSFHPTFRIFRHLPAGLGFYLGIALGLPMLTCTYLAEIFAVLFYVGIGFLVLKVAPVKKEIFAFCLLIPECLQQCASVSYDAVLIPVSMLLFAYILNLYNREELIHWKQVCLVAVMTFVIFVSKAPYALIALTVFIIPSERFELKIGQKIEIAHLIRKYRIWILPAMVALCGLGVYLMRDNPQIKTAIADVLSLPDFLKLLKRTFTQYGFDRITQLVGVFGWLDSQVTAGFVLLFAGMMVWLNTNRTESPKRELSFGRRIWMILVAAFAAWICEVAIQEYTYKFLSYDASVGIDQYREYIRNLDSILGFQGRYWIPVLPVVLVGLSGKTTRKGTPGYYLIQVAYYAYAFVTVVQILRYRYWV